MDIRHASNPCDAKHYTTERLREEFLIETLFVADEITMTYSHIDRIIAGGMMPVNKGLSPKADKELGVDYFLERRELGVINIGGPGRITLDGKVYEMNPRDAIYVGMGTRELLFESTDAANPAKFYFNSCPAHKTYDTVKIDIAKAQKRKLGTPETANVRTINQIIHPDVCKTCQLTMGMTALEPGSVWNTMPSHTHGRRMEVYRASRSAACNPQAVRGHFGNPALASR